MDIIAIIKEHLPEGVDVSDKALKSMAKDINGEIGKEFVPKESYSKKTKEVSELEAKLAESAGATTEIEALKQQLADERKAHKETKDGYAAEKTAATTDSLVTAMLKEAGMNEAAIPKALKLYDRATVETADGKITNADKVLEHFKCEWKDFFMKVEDKGTNPAAPPANNGSPYAGKTATELMQIANDDPSKLNDVLAQIEKINNPKKE